MVKVRLLSTLVLTRSRTFGGGDMKDIFLVHGELEQAEAFEQQLRKSGYRNIHIPNRGDTTEYEL